MSDLQDNKLGRLLWEAMRTWFLQTMGWVSQERLSLLNVANTRKMNLVLIPGIFQHVQLSFDVVIASGRFHSYEEPKER